MMPLVKTFVILLLLLALSVLLPVLAYAEDKALWRPHMVLFTESDVRPMAFGMKPYDDVFLRGRDCETFIKARKPYVEITLQELARIKEVPAVFAHDLICDIDTGGQPS